MFYSQTYLARKGPLSTVWIAAHLQHRLKKSHYTSTDIPSTVQHIMDPGVPIALRMSGHLLLGVVRIYSKKVDYLFHDCNEVLTGLSKAFATIQLNLPQDASKAPFQSITLPNTFDLDALNLDEEIDHRAEDVHVRRQEDITLADQVPIEMDHYVAISFDEGITIMVDSSSNTEVFLDSGAIPMEEDIIPNLPTTQSIGVECPPNVQNPEVTTGLGSSDIHPPQEVEVLRDANNDHIPENPLLFQVNGDNDAEQNMDLDQIMNEKDHIPETVDNLDPEGISAPFEQPFQPPTPVTSQGAASDAHVFGEFNSPNLVLQPSPPIPQPQPQRRGRKRKQPFDKSIVLTNRFMRKALHNTRDILRQTKEAPLSTLDVWKHNVSRMKEHIFDRPLLTGSCKDLQDISRDGYIRSKSHLVISEEDNAEDGIVRTPSTHQSPEVLREATSMEVLREATPPITASEMDNERLRNIVATSPPRVLAHDMNMEFNIAGDYGSAGASPLKTNVAFETMQTPDSAASPGVHGSEMETPVTYMDDTSQNFGLSDTHHLINSAETEELGFLEVENNTPTSSQGTSTTSSSINTLSVRTRAVAQYLKRQSPISPIMEDTAEELSLNKILEGKTRKISARMFYEVLVLKTHGLVDVQQEEPYGDISLKLTPTLSSAQL